MLPLSELADRPVTQLTMEELRYLIDKSDVAYYDNRPGVVTTISDVHYDQAKQRLKLLCPQDERISRVGPSYTDEELRSKVQHPIMMGSLENTDDGILGYESWLSKCGPGLQWLPVLASLKLDGSSIRASYEKGRLTMVATRGNGQVGDNITKNGVNFQHLPIFLNKNITCDVRGEAILPVDNFKSLVEQEHGRPFGQIDPKSISNPRNVGNGFLLRDSGDEASQIHFYAFNIESPDIQFETEQDKFEYLNQLGFNTVPFAYCSSVRQFTDYYDSVVSKRADLPFEIDGLVATIDPIVHQRQLSNEDSARRPKYARAVKFPHKSVVAKVIGLDITVGHTGALIPTAILESIRIGGVNVEHVLLNNWDEISNLKINSGDQVELVLAGDIIPKVVRCVSKGLEQGYFPEPTHCPSCGSIASRLLRGKIGATVFCTSLDDCPAVRVAKIKHWIGGSKTGIGILGIGDAIIKSLWDAQLVSDIADLYTLTVAKIRDLELEGGMRVGESRAQLIIDNINAKRILPLHIFLGSLGIELLGRRRAQLLQKSAKGQLDNLDQWLDPAVWDSIEIPGLGQATRNAIKEGMHAHAYLINRLIHNGVSILATKKIETTPADDGLTPTRKPLEGTTFCLTGTRECITDIERLGGEVKSGVSKGLTYLVQKDASSVSSKTTKAHQLGVSVISLDRLREIIREAE